MRSPRYRRRRYWSSAQPFNSLYRHSTAKFGLSMKVALLIWTPGATMSHVSPSPWVRLMAAALDLPAWATDWLSREASSFQVLEDSFSLLSTCCLFWHFPSFVFKRLRTLSAKYRGVGVGLDSVRI